jgi:hypothetical protein
MKTKFTYFMLIFFGWNITTHAQWAQTSFTTGVISSLASDGTTIYAGSPNGVHVSTDNGNTWTLSQLGLGYNANAIAVNGSTVFAGATNGGVFTSTNSATSWNQTPGGTYNALSISGSNVFAGTNGGVLLSTNTGGSWSNILSGSVWALATSGSTILTGINGGPGSGVRISTNSGSSWTTYGLTNKNFYSFLINGSMMFAGTASGDGGLYMSSDNGANWTQSAGSNGFNALVGIGNNVFAGTSSGGVRLSTNNGTSWAAVNTGLTPYDIRSLVIVGSDIYCGTYGNGVWKRALSEMVVGVEELEKSHVNLFPNPSAGTFKIESDNKFSKNITVEVYNLLGDKILEQYELGEINLSHVSKGIYFVKIDEDGKGYTKKIIIE